MSKRILLLDDDTELLDVMQIMLTDAGYEPILFGDTNDLFSLVRAHQPSLIILDFRLKHRDGGEWCIKLKNHPDFKKIPVMIYSACSQKIEKGSYGCDDFLAKPFDIDEMLARVRHLIQDFDLRTTESENLNWTIVPRSMLNHYDTY